MMENRSFDHTLSFLRAPNYQIEYDLAFDHTSILATAMTLFTGAGVWPSNILGDRAMNAKTFNIVLDLNAAATNGAARLRCSDAGSPRARRRLTSLQYEQVWHAAELEKRLPLFRRKARHG
jgi:hypothetical protein